MECLARCAVGRVVRWRDLCRYSPPHSHWLRSYSAWSLGTCCPNLYDCRLRSEFARDGCARTCYAGTSGLALCGNGTTRVYAAGFWVCVVVAPCVSISMLAATPVLAPHTTWAAIIMRLRRDGST